MLSLRQSFSSSSSATHSEKVSIYWLHRANTVGHRVFQIFQNNRAQSIAVCGRVSQLACLAYVYDDVTYVYDDVTYVLQFAGECLN